MLERAALPAPAKFPKGQGRAVELRYNPPPVFTRTFNRFPMEKTPADAVATVRRYYQSLPARMQAALDEMKKPLLHQAFAGALLGIASMAGADKLL